MNSHATLKTHHREATTGASRAKRGNAKTILAHVAGEERRDMKRHPSRGKSGLHSVDDGGHSAQGIVRVVDINGKRNLSAPGGQQPGHMHPFIGGCVYEQLCLKNIGVMATENTKFRDRKGKKADVGATPLSIRVLSIIVFSTRLKSASRDGGLEIPNKLVTTASRSSFEPRMPW
jgi:hypothetical protein